MSYPRPAMTIRRWLLVVSLAVLVACGQDLTREELLDRARGALVEGNVNAAVVDVKTALQQSPNDAEGRRLYGEILLQQRNLPQAAEEFRRSLNASFKPQVAVLYAHALVDAGQPEDVVDLDAEGFFDAVADDPAYLAARARAEAGDGNFFAAADTLDEAEALDPSLPAVRRARALVLAQHTGDLAAAAELLEELVAEHPEDADGWSLYAGILRARGDLAEAEAAYARAGELNRFRLPDRLNHMMLLIESEQYDAAEVALELWREGARVTVVMRSDRFHTKYWVEPDIENRIKEGSIKAYFNTTVKEIRPSEVVLEGPEGAFTIENDFVLAMTGYLPNYELLERLGLDIPEEPPRIPQHDPDTLETTLPNVYLAGVVCAGMNTSKLFIENTRDHGDVIIENILKKQQKPELA